MKNMKKWDSKIAAQLLASCTGKDQLQLKVLELCKNQYRTTSMVKKVVSFGKLSPEKRQPILAELKLTEAGFIRLHAFCITIYAESWRPLTDEEEAMHKASRRFQELKRTRKPIEWVWNIGFLPKPERAHTACVVWWDIFAEREVSNRFKNFDKWLNGFQKSQLIPNAALRKNLIRLGYPKLIAERRVLGEDVEEQIEESETV